MFSILMFPKKYSEMLPKNWEANFPPKVGVTLIQWKENLIENSVGWKKEGCEIEFGYSRSIFKSTKRGNLISLKEEEGEEKKGTKLSYLNIESPLLYATMNINVPSKNTQFNNLLLLYNWLQAMHRHSVKSMACWQKHSSTIIYHQSDPPIQVRFKLIRITVIKKSVWYCHFINSY